MVRKVLNRGKGTAYERKGIAMSSDGRYYWVKLDYSRFENGGDLDFLMGQPNGSEYVALYLMLCLNTRNTDGELISKLGEVIIPYDVEKIKRDCKYFSRDTIVIALSLFKQLGLIFEQENGILKINSFDSMVGSTSTSAARVKRMRERQKTLAIESECNTVQQDNTEALHCNAKCNKNVTTDIRDKSLDIREKNKEVTEDSLKDNKLSSRSSSFVQPHSDNQWTTNGQPMDCIGKDSIGEDSIGEVIIYHEDSSNKLPKTANQKGTNTKKTEFIPPTLEEIEEYISAENIANVNAKKFFDHYSDPDRDWRDGKGKKMSNWKLTVRTWSRNDFGSSNQAMAISSNLSKAEQEYAAWGAEQDRILQERAEKKMNQRKHDDCPF